MSWVSWSRFKKLCHDHALRIGSPSPRARTRPRWRPLTLERLEDRTLLSAAPLLPNDLLVDQLGAVGEVDVRQLTLAEAGLLTITARGLSAGLDTRLSLARSDGALLIQSEGQTTTDRSDCIEQHLAAGTYLVRIESTTAQTGDYQLRTTFAAASPPFQQIPLGTNPVAVVLADFNGDGVLDMATANAGSNDVSILTGVGDGTFLSQQSRFAVGVTPTALALGDFNGDHKLDLVVTSAAAANNVRVLLGKGDGTFTVLAAQTVGAGITAVAVGDFNGDHKLDLAVAHNGINRVSVLCGAGAGMFANSASLQVGTAPTSIAVGDFDGDGHLDLVTANNNATTKGLSLLRGDGQGGFAAAVSIGVGEVPMTVVAGDFDNDGDLDLACTNQLAFNVSIFLNDGAGHFGAGTRFAAGRRPTTMQTGDFNGDGVLDLAVANIFSVDVSVLLGKGDGTFQPQLLYNVGLILAGQLPQALAIGDLNGDGQLDIVSANSATSVAFVLPNSVSVLLGRGDGTFRENRGFAVGDAPNPLAIADFNGDGRLDVVMPNVGSNDVSVLLGLADGTFQPQQRFAVDNTPGNVVVGDFNEDGRLDLAVPNSAVASASLGITISILLGIGDGTFQSQIRVPAGFAPYALMAVDLNNDGHLDLAAVNRAKAAQGGDSLSVFLGRGDGTFIVRGPYALNDELPQAIQAADLNGDGVLDLVVANVGSRQPATADEGSITVLLGRFDESAPNGWTMDVQPPLRAGVGPITLLVEDLNGDGLLDVLTPNRGPGVSQPGPSSNVISLFLGHKDDHGAWSLLPQEQFTVVGAPTLVASADLNGDGRRDLVIGPGGGAGSSAEISVLLGIEAPPGTSRIFAAEHRFAIPGPINVPSMALKDFNGDGRLDVAVTSQSVFAAGILLGNGDGTFQPFTTFALNAGPVGVNVADFNGDGFHDLITANKFSDDVSVLLGLGNGTFVPATTTPNPIRSVPMLADLNGDGVLDLVVLNNNGRILYRAGRPGEPGVYAPPLLVNPGATAAARELTLVRRGNSTILAAIDADGAGVSLYSFVKATGAFQRTVGPDVLAALPARIVAGDVNRDGRDDLVVAAASSGLVEVYLRASNGAFPHRPSSSIGVGVNPTSLQLLDVDSNGWLDVVAVNQFSADVSVIHNGPAGLAAHDQRYRAGIGLYGVALFDGAAVARAQEGSVGLALGDFDGDGNTDAVVANSGSNRLVLLRGSGNGGFLNPSPEACLKTGSFPTTVVAGHFDSDQFLDLAVLCEDADEIVVFLGDGHGGFTSSFSAAAGNVPTGLALADVNGDGRVDLLVGNQFGDILILAGNGDGSFEAYRRTERAVSLAVADLDGDGQRDFVLANESLDRVVVQYGRPGDDAWQSGAGILGPEAVETTDLNGDGILDLVVSNGGGNNLLVYLGLGNGQFAAARSFFTGANPSGFTVADLDGNGWLDMVVANEGSNDVSVLLGQGTRTANGAVTSWGLNYGPRLNAGYDPVTGTQVGLGPVATAVSDITGDGVLDVLVTNHASNNVALLAGIGNGFFNDQGPAIFAVGLDPRQILVGDFDGLRGIDFLTINAGSNSVTFFSGATGAGVQIGTGGLRPIAAFTGDFNDDGLSDLMVAHNGNGLFALLVGTPTGPEIAGSLTDVHILHPTDLALASQRNGILELFACDEGREVIFFLTFDFRPSPVTSELLPLRDAELAAVAIFVAGAGGESLVEAEAAATEVRPSFQAFVVGLDIHPTHRDGAKDGEGGRSGDFAAPIEIMDEIFRDLIKPIGAEFAHAGSMFLESSLTALARVTATDAREANHHWESMLRALVARTEPPTAPPVESAEEAQSPPPGSEPCAPVPEVHAEQPWSYWVVQTPAVVVIEIATSMLGIWMLDRWRRTPALPAIVRRPQE